MATISNTPRPGYVWDSTDNVWYPIGVGAHQHTNAADTPAVIPNALVDAKGDLLTATADNTPARLAVGSNNQVLTADSSTATGLKWATPAGGKVLQVVNVINNTFAQSTTTTYADTPLSATITPTSATSKVLVLVTQDIGKSNTNSTINLKVMRGSTSIVGSQAVELGLYTGTLMEMYSFNYPFTVLDSPATTSATTYKTQFAVRAGGTGAVFVAGQGSYSTMTLLEIGA